MSIYPSNRTPASLGYQKAKLYSFNEFDDDEHEENVGSPPMRNVFAAAFYIASLIRDAGFQYALLGGAALVALGQDRKTDDADIGTDASMSDLWRILDQDRVILPDTKLLSGIIRLFVKTGPSFGDTFTDADEEVIVDILQAGGIAVPQNIQDHLNAVDMNIGDLPVTITCLDSFTLLRNKLRAFAARGSFNDFSDCCFLLQREDLTSEDAADLGDEYKFAFVESEYFSGLGGAERQYYRARLGV